MSGHENPAGLWPADGAGVLARRGGLILLSSLPDTRLPDQLLDLLAEVADAGGDGLRFTQAVEAALDADGSWRLSSEGQEGPAVVALGTAGGGLAICVTGGAWAEITTRHGAHRFGKWPAILLQCLVASEVLTVRGGLGGYEDEARTDRFSRLDSGVVRAGGFAYHVAQDGPGTRKLAEVRSDAGPAVPEARPDGTAEHTTVAARPAEPPAETRAEPGESAAVAAEPAELTELAEPAGEAAEPVTANTAAVRPAPPESVPPRADTPQPFKSMLLLGEGERDDTQVRPPLPLEHDQEHDSGDLPAAPEILGVYCKNGHFDDPNARFCAVCGISMNQKTLVPQTGPRPPLGLLVLDSGHIFQLDTDYVIGREPTLNADVAAGTARPLRIPDDTGTMSRVHAKIQLDGWHVLVADLGSANGTSVQLPNKATEQRLTPRKPVRLRPGSRVVLGETGFRYESHRGR